MKQIKLHVTLKEGDEILHREAKNFGGNASHIILPAKHRNKKVVIVCAEEVEEIGKDKK